jgi:TPR repeat protein
MRKILVAIAVALSVSSSAWAGFAEGASAYNAKNYALALREITPLARAGNADAQHLLGLMFYMGRGVKRDYKQAFEWHRKAALQGKADAEYVIAAMYYQGNAVPQDDRQAVYWFRKAAEQGHPEAQHALALMNKYHKSGVPQDYVIAYMLWNLSAASGNMSAVEQRAAISKQMSQEQIEEGQALSSSWRPGTPLPTQSRTGASG